MIFLCIIGFNSLIWGDYKIFCLEIKIFLIKVNNSWENWFVGIVINVDGDWLRVGLILVLGNVILRVWKYWVDIYIDIVGDKIGCLYIYRNYYL